MCLLVSKHHNRIGLMRGKGAPSKSNSDTIVPEKFSKKIQGEAILTATYLINRLPSKLLGLESPMDILFSFYPYLNTINNLKPRIFGCVSFARKNKVNPDVSFGKNLVYKRKYKVILKSIQVQESNSTPLDKVTISDLLTSQDETETWLPLEKEPENALNNNSTLSPLSLI